MSGSGFILTLFSIYHKPNKHKLLRQNKFVYTFFLVFDHWSSRFPCTFLKCNLSKVYKLFESFCRKATNHSRNALSKFDTILGRCNVVINRCFYFQTFEVIKKSNFSCCKFYVKKITENNAFLEIFMFNSTCCSMYELFESCTIFRIFIALSRVDKTFINKQDLGGKVLYIRVDIATLWLNPEHIFTILSRFTIHVNILFLHCE